MVAHIDDHASTGAFCTAGAFRVVLRNVAYQKCMVLTDGRGAGSTPVASCVLSSTSRMLRPQEYERRLMEKDESIAIQGRALDGYKAQIDALYAEIARMEVRHNLYHTTRAPLSLPCLTEPNGSRRGTL